MSDADLELKFGADASGVTAGAAEANESVKSVGASVRGLLDLMLELGGAATGSFREMRAGAIESGESIKGVAESITEIREAIAGFGEALIAAFAVEQIAEFAKKMGETAEAVLRTAQTFGLTVGEVQKMNAEAALFGVPAESMTTAMQRLDKAFSTAKEGGTQQAAAFKEIGVNIQGAYTQTQLMQAALEGLSNMDAGPAKIAAAMELFGRDIQQIGSLLGLTKDQIEEASATIDQYGAINETAAAKGVALSDALSVNKVAGMGLNNVFTDSLAPAFTVIVEGINGMIKSFIQSYEAGGAAKQVMDALAWTVKACADTIGLFGVLTLDVFKTFDAGAWALEAVIDPLGDLVAGVCRTMIDSFKSFGDIARDALTMNWGAIAGDIKSGAERVAADVSATAANMGRTAAQNFKKAADEYMSTDSDIAGFEAWSKKLWSGAGTQAQLPKEGVGTTAQDQNKNPKPDKDRVQEWEQQFQDIEAASGDFFGDETAKELAYWQNILATQNLTKTEILAIKRQMFGEEKTLAEQARSEALAKIEGETRDQIQAENAKTKAALDGIQARMAAVRAAGQRGDISPGDEKAQLEALNDQEVALEQAKADAIYQINLNAVHQREAIYATDPVNLAKVQATEQGLAKQHQDQLTEISAQGEKNRQKIEDDGAKQFEQSWNKSITPMVESFGQAMLKMGQGTETFAQAVNRVASQIESSLVNAAAKMVSHWVMSEAEKTMATQAGAMARNTAEEAGAIKSRIINFETNEKQIMNEAAGAAAAAYKAMAGIPIIGPALGVAAAGVTFAAVEAYGAMASAAGGYDIPSGLNPIVQTHAEEMILPAVIANPLRGMISDYQQGAAGQGFGAQQPGPPQLGSLHLHFGPGSDGDSLQRFFDNHGAKILKTVNRQLRNGASLQGASR